MLFFATTDLFEGNMPNEPSKLDASDPNGRGWDNEYQWKEAMEKRVADLEARIAALEAERGTP